MRLKIILFYILFLGSFLYAQDYKLIINDSITSTVKKGRIELIEIEVEVKNNTLDSFYINKEVGVIAKDFPFIAEEVESYCEDYNWKGIYQVIIYDDSCQILLGTPILGRPIPVFLKNGRFKRVPLLKIKYYERRRAQPIKFFVKPYDQERFRMKIYLGDFTLEKGKHYYLKLKYTNKADDNLTKVTCLESNKMVLITK